MKKLSIVLIISMLGFTSASAQEEDERIRDKSVSLELLGPSVLVGATYDARFKADSKWGYRAGVGFTSFSSIGILGNEDKNYSVMMPLGINFLQGEGKGKLELGAGVTLGVSHDSHDEFMCDFIDKGDGFYEQTNIREERVSKTTFGHFFYGNIGYRHVAKNGFQFRCGISPSFTVNKKDFDFVVFWPYVSFGYAF